MPLILPTAQNIPDALYVHHAIAILVNAYPNIPSIGTTIPIKLVSTKGNKQYPSTLALRRNVSVLERCADPAEPGTLWSWCAFTSAADRGGDISERIKCKDVLPSSASP